ncbi:MULTISPECIES: thermostable hemolysin [unclassified Achromobacter]|uniref:thermostable hemolysin n=1 Tax=unclassified Achromobacter TaxID=2626865 RepID=UPI000B51C923|nr:MULTISPECIES: thermostable hemolysin [unclassified Achromobacter]OWT74684.1 thermostable hemolysin [Achromobacter sp. HZ34]OWT79151.1 thermostable hemolysin [Achromobacter sp. HZ28]
MPRFRTGIGSSELVTGAHPTPHFSLHIHSGTDVARGRVETYIRDRYRARFGAHITAWMPTLVSLQADGEILAAAGYRPATEVLFLERYLAAPVEQYMAEQGISVSRKRVVEAGQFASVRPGAGRLLVPYLAKHLHDAGFEWSVCTLTGELHHLFSRMGLAHQPLSLARPDLLDAREKAQWGTYYDHAPQVFAGRLACIVSRFQESEA